MGNAMSKVSVVLGSTREGRLGERVANWVLQQAPGAELLDLKAINLPFYDEAKTPDDLNGNYSNPVAQQWHDKIVGTDCLVFVTPEYNHSYPGVLKNAIDYMFSAWKGKRYMIVSYSSGGWAGVRAAMQLRGLLDYIGLDCHGEINLPLADQLIAVDGTMSDPKLTDRLKKSLAALQA